MVSSVWSVGTGNQIGGKTDGNWLWSMPDIQPFAELVSKMRWRLASEQVVSCCVYFNPQNMQQMHRNIHICLTIDWSGCSPTYFFYSLLSCWMITFFLQNILVHLIVICPTYSVRVLYKAVCRSKSYWRGWRNWRSLNFAAEEEEECLTTWADFILFGFE